MSVTVPFVDSITPQELLVSGVDGASQPVIFYDGFNGSRTLHATSTPGGAATKVVCRLFALVAGALTLDLTTITGANGVAQNGTGLRVQIWRIKNLGAGAMTFVQGASNPYLLKGSGWKVILAQNQKDIFDGYNAAPVIGGGAKEIDVTGTGTETFQLTLVMG